MMTHQRPGGDLISAAEADRAVEAAVGTRGSETQPGQPTTNPEPQDAEDDEPSR